jgi:hypothetical protein
MRLAFWLCLAAVSLSGISSSDRERLLDLLRK